MPDEKPAGPRSKAKGTGRVTVTAVNTLQIARPAQTIELSAGDLAVLGENDVTRIHVADATGRDLLIPARETPHGGRL